MNTIEDIIKILDSNYENPIEEDAENIYTIYKNMGSPNIHDIIFEFSAEGKYHSDHPIEKRWEKMIVICQGLNLINGDDYDIPLTAYNWWEWE